MKKLFLALVALLLASVSPAQVGQSSLFPYVAVPTVIQNSPSAPEWYVLHYWDDYRFEGATTRYLLDTTRQGMVGFIGALYSVPPEKAFEAIDTMLTRAAVDEDSYWLFLEMGEEVFYDPSSPLRNDLFWERYLRHAVGEKSPLDEDSRVRYRSLLKLVSRNQQGSLATDFVYTLADGREGRLFDLSSPLVLLYFYNPGCSECAYAREQLIASPELSSLHSRGVIKVVALYPDEDLSAWRKHLAEHPSWWITAYDKGNVISRKELYDLKAIPTFYLLDGRKRVLAKDPDVERLIDYLSQL